MPETMWCSDWCTAMKTTKGIHLKRDIRRATFGWYDAINYLMNPSQTV